MFKMLPNSTSAIVVIFIALLGCLFICQTVLKFVFYLVARFKKTSYSGYELLDFLKDKNNMNEVNIKKEKFNVLSTFYSYRKKKNEFIISNNLSKQENLYNNIKVIESIVYANEQKNRTLQFKWKFYGIGFVTFLAYIVLIAIMLLTYLPTVKVDGRLAIGYWMSVEVLCIIGYILILISLFWWMSVTQNLEIEIDQQTKKISNDKNLNYMINSYMKYCSYVPFSFRTIL